MWPSRAIIYRSEISYLGGVFFFSSSSSMYMYGRQKSGTVVSRNCFHMLNFAVTAGFPWTMLLFFWSITSIYKPCMWFFNANLIYRICPELQIRISDSIRNIFDTSPQKSRRFFIFTILNWYLKCRETDRNKDLQKQSYAKTSIFAAA